MDSRVSGPVSFESRCLELGQEILERARSAEPPFWNAAWWQQRALDMSLHYEALKVQLFRFIDVLPVLRDDQEIARHLREYLDPDRMDMPSPARLLMGYGCSDSRHAKFVAGLTRRAARMMAESFIAGSNADEAIGSIYGFRGNRMAFTLDVLGEYTSNDSQADRYQQTYLDLIGSLCPVAKTWPVVSVIDECVTGPMPRVNISIKLTALSARFDAIDAERSMESVCRRLRPILRRARELGAFINVDMESYAYRDLTLELFTRLFMEDEFRDMTDVGIVVQAYLRDGEQDFDRLLDWVRRRENGMAVRLVKGAYWDVETTMATQNNSPSPVWLQKWESDACYERIARKMLMNHALVRPAFASHNVRSLAAVMTMADDMGLTPGHYEVQMLHGMGNPLKQAIVEMGQCLRVYTPYGEMVAGMGYLIRRLLENTANDSFLRQSYRVRDIGPLLANPAVARPPSLPPRRLQSDGFEEDSWMSEFRNEPIISFVRKEDRAKFASAIAFIRGELGQEYPLWIDGVAVRTDEWFDSVNPASPNEVIGRAALATTADADRAVAAAQRALKDWRCVEARVRADYLHKTADVLRKRRFELAAWMTLEAGKPWREADADVAEAIDYLDYYAYHATHLAARPHRRDLPGESNHLTYEPKGVCVVLAPWSFPLALLTNMTAAALAAGNTVVIKPASATPVIAAKLCGVLHELGVPPGVVNLIMGPGASIGRHLVRHAGVQLVAFTGSRDVGTEIIRVAPDASPSQRHIKMVVAEMGGKNAIIVDDDADLDEAVGGVVKSAFGYSGQKCTSCSRVIVMDSVYDDFCGRLTETSRTLPIGPAEDPGTVVGPLIDLDSVERVKSYVEIGRREGKILLDRSHDGPSDGGFYVGPIVIADVDRNATIAQEEIFGPLLSVMRAADFDEAICIANDTRYALTGGLYSRSPKNIEKCKRDFLVGNLYINRKITGSRVDIEPFGGLKMSGHGAKAGGPEYLHCFCDARTITEHTLRHGLASAQEVQTTT